MTHWVGSGDSEGDRVLRKTKERVRVLNEKPKFRVVRSRLQDVV